MARASSWGGALAPWPEVWSALSKWASEVASPTGLAAIALGSALLSIVSLGAASWVVLRLPPDYLRREHPRPARFARGWLVWALRNVAGGVAVVLGLAMIVLPGQGLLTLAAGLALLDFPGKRRMERRVLGAPRVLRAVNRFRRRAGRAPMQSAAPGDAPPRREP